MGQANHSDQRPAKPGDRCVCGRPALTVFVTEKFGAVPYCGSQHPYPSVDDVTGDAITDDEMRAMSVERLTKVARRLTKLAEETLRIAQEAVETAGRAGAILDERKP